MSITRSILSAALPLMLCTVTATLGCRGDDGDDNPDTDGGMNGTDGGDPGADISIQEVQDDGLASGSQVTLRGVVVVAIDKYGTSRKGSIYVMEPEGGEFSGVYVFLKGAEATGLKIGDLVDVEGGVKDEFALSEDTSGDTMTEISAPEGGAITLTDVGDGTVPAAAVVDPVMLASDPAVAEKWESVLIKIENVSVSSPPTDEGEKAHMFVTGPLSVSAEMVELPDTIAAGDCYASITGVVNYFFNYSLLPTQPSDLAAGGTCLPPEDTEELCQDTMDNDADGFTDCEDRSCALTAACTVDDATVVKVQDGTIPTSRHVEIVGAVVTAISEDRENIWIQDATGAAQYNGVGVYRGSMPNDLEIDVGSIVDIDGVTAEYNTDTQIVAIAGGPALVTKTADPAAVPAVFDGATFLAKLADAGDAGEPFEGLLVTIPNLTVEEVDMTHNEATVGDGTTSIVINDTIFAFSVPAVGDCLTVTGIMAAEDFGTPRRAILPRSAADITTGTCN